MFLAAVPSLQEPRPSPNWNVRVGHQGMNLFRIHFESILNISLGVRRNPGSHFRALLPIQCLEGRRRETVLCAGKNIFQIHFESILNLFQDEGLYSWQSEDPRPATPYR